MQHAAALHLMVGLEVDCKEDVIAVAADVELSEEKKHRGEGYRGSGGSGGARAWRRGVNGRGGAREGKLGRTVGKGRDGKGNLAVEREGKGMAGREKGKGPKRVVGRLRERLVVALDNAALDVVVGDPVLVGHRSDLGEHHWRLVRI